MSEQQPSPTIDAAARVPFRTLALWSLLVAIASLTSLVLVASVRDADVLSVVAMALAVLAFVVQIIVFIVQTAEAGRQSREGQVLHGQLVALFSRIEERTQGTQVAVDRVNERLIEAVIGKATGEGLDRVETAERVVAAVSDPAVVSHAEAEPPDPTEFGFTWPPPLSPVVARRYRANALRWPPVPHLDEVKRTLDNLSPRARSSLFRLAADLIASTRDDATFGPGFSGTPPRELVEMGLVDVDGPHYSLTAKGRLVGRVATARGRLPEELSALQPYADEAQNVLASLPR
ncbi:hypothetical protein RDI86_01420 [Cellulosimicrobium sp. XJ-DQ-B-000]|uniref:hypothetical protein n=1 Tax=Cellulosimicrobium sp. XJ-DQ-B-000 TaxID=3072182 RepID=UPI0028092F11|nr:hypothetical protein [Cellulosimicrobium sp. XJ-DQ-B-000]MDQ8040508.1 hypothetical protein [Cellulosimicrobium sp. XJ-DQ-B-000]